MTPLQGNQFLQLDPDQKRRASSRVTDPLSHLALLDASSPKGGAFEVETGRYIQARPSGELARKRLRGAFYRSTTLPTSAGEAGTMPRTALSVLRWTVKVTLRPAAKSGW